MTPLSPTELMAVALQYEHKPSFDERMREAESRMPRLFVGSWAMNPRILRSALFGLGNDPARNYETRYPCGGGGYVEYSGKGLTPWHATVLYALMHNLRGKNAGNVIELVPRAFAIALGWADTAGSVARLSNCVSGMRGASLRVAADDSESNLGAPVGIVKDCNFEGKKWSVWLATDIVALVNGHPTYLNIQKRRQLRDGLQTWMYDFVCANNCVIPFKLDLLHGLSGSHASTLREFGRQLRDRVLPRLVEIGAIRDFETSRGRVHIIKQGKHTE